MQVSEDRMRCISMACAWVGMALMVVPLLLALLLAPEHQTGTHDTVSLYHALQTVTNLPKVGVDKQTQRPVTMRRPPTPAAVGVSQPMAKRGEAIRAAQGVEAIGQQLAESMESHDVMAAVPSVDMDSWAMLLSHPSPENYAILVQLLFVPVLLGGLLFLWRPRKHEAPAKLAMNTVSPKVEAASVSVDVKTKLLEHQKLQKEVERKDRPGAIDVKGTIYFDRNPPTDPILADSEVSRYFRRKAYTMADWRSHRSVGRKGRDLWQILSSRIIYNVLEEVLAIVIISTFIAVAQDQAGLNFLVLPGIPFALSASSLGFLLVFRTNESAHRFNEVRILWGLLLNRTRDTTRQVAGWFPDSKQDLKDQFLRQIVALPWTLKVHLRGGPGGFEDDRDLMDDLEGKLPQEELECLLNAAHRPNHLVSNLTDMVSEANLDPIREQQINKNLTTFADIIGGNERILRTPIPLAYTHLSSRFLSLWLLFLPFSLSREIEKAGLSVWTIIPSTAFIAFLLLSIEEVAVQLEEPFSVLPLEAVCTTAETNLRECMNKANEWKEKLWASRNIKAPNDE